MSEKSEKLRAELMSGKKTVEIEKAVQLSRIADALESIEETGVYTWPQDDEALAGQKEAEPRRQG